MASVSKKARYSYDSRHKPCHCPLDNGRIRDSRTVRRHASLFQSLPESQQEDLSKSESSTENYERNSVSSNLETDGYSESYDSESSHDESCTSNTSFSDNNHGVGVSQDCMDEEEIFVLSDIDIENYLLKASFRKLKAGLSQARFQEQLSDVYELLHGDQRITTEWPSVVKLLRQLGYHDPKHYKVCCGGNHSRLLKTKQPCPVCNLPWKDGIDYYVVGVNPEGWFVTEVLSNQKLAHWRSRDEWLNRGCPTVPRSQSWHGQRMMELSYFWDPAVKTLLPIFCKSCNYVLPVDEIKNQVEVEEIEGEVTFVCNHCFQEFTSELKYMQGDPRNQAINMHFDGFNAFHNNCCGKSIASISFSSACVTKEIRNHDDNVELYSFVPVSQLPQDCPHKFDGFLEPLIQDLERLYICGKQVEFRARVPELEIVGEPGLAQIRVVPLLITADLKGHAEIGLTTAGGRKGCRKCLVTGVYSIEKRHYYYGEFKKRNRFPEVARTAFYNREHGKDCDDAGCTSHRHNVQRLFGVTGESIIFRLYDLCGFDPVQDLVIDIMHCLCLNLVKTELVKHIWQPLDVNTDSLLESRNPQLGGLVERSQLATNLKKVPWTSEQRDGHIPKITTNPAKIKTDNLGGWVAESYNNFALVAPFVLYGIIPSRAYDCLLQLHYIRNMVYNGRLRSSGWTGEDVEKLRSLTVVHAILFEEYYKIDSCTENLEYSTHIADEIIRHSSLDNYWTYVYERLVHFYREQSSNKKQIGKTFADRAAQLKFIRTKLLQRGITMEPVIAKDELRSLGKQRLHEMSLNKAKFLCETILDSDDLDVIDKVEVLAEEGVLVGGLKDVELNDHQVADIHSFLQERNGSNPIPILHRSQLGKIAKTCRSVFITQKKGCATLYRKGEACVMSGSMDGEEWIGRIKDIFSYSYGGTSYTFLDFDYFVPQVRNSQPVINSWTGTFQLEQRAYRRNCLQKPAAVKRKILLYPDHFSTSNSTPNYWLAVDENNIPDIVLVPYYPQEGDHVKVKGQQNEFWFAKILNCLVGEENVDVQWYVEIPRSRGVFKLGGNNQISRMSIIKAVKVKRLETGKFTIQE